jgi:hypothetical protein
MVLLCNNLVCMRERGLRPEGCQVMNWQQRYIRDQVTLYRRAERGGKATVRYSPVLTWQAGTPETK